MSATRTMMAFVATVCITACNVNPFATKANLDQPTEVSAQFSLPESLTPEEVDDIASRRDIIDAVLAKFEPDFERVQVYKANGNKTNAERAATTWIMSLEEVTDETILCMSASTERKTEFREALTKADELGITFVNDKTLLVRLDPSAIQHIVTCASDDPKMFYQGEVVIGLDADKNVVVVVE